MTLDDNRTSAVAPPWDGFACQGDHQPGLADAGLTDEHDILSLRDEFQLSQRADLALLDALLLLERGKTPESSPP